MTFDGAGRPQLLYMKSRYMTPDMPGHAAQGSEYPAVVIPLVTQHYSMLRRNLVYTAVTRGKKLVEWWSSASRRR